MNSNVTLNFLDRSLAGTGGIKPGPDKVQAIVNVPHPTNVHEVRSFLGMVNQFSKFTTNLADMAKPIRDLLIKNAVWIIGTCTVRGI